MTFTATEFGFEGGLGGASNSKSDSEYHYVLFGWQVDSQHPENSGIYFEYDDQSNGSVDSVREVWIGDKSIKVTLKSGEDISINCEAVDWKWDEFLFGVRSIFPSKLVKV